jgi:RNA polymerase sigma-70 factor (ECF subfamily)
MEPIEPQALLTGHPLANAERADEAQMVHRALQGDQAAWETLLAGHYQPVFRLAYLLVGDAAEAEDIAQETFIRAYFALERFDVTRPLRPWLLKIAANLARNRARSLSRYLAALKRAFLFEAQTPPPAIDQLGERNLENRRLWQLVQRLSLADRQVIYLRYFLDLSVEDSAEALGVALGTVKSRLYRALERLRHVIQQDAPELEDKYDET